MVEIQQEYLILVILNHLSFSETNIKAVNLFLPLQLELMKTEPIQNKGTDYADFWMSELAKCVRDIQGEYDKKTGLIQQDCEAEYSTQVSTKNWR